MAKPDPFKTPHASYMSQSELDSESMQELFIKPRFGPPREDEEDLNYNQTAIDIDVDPMSPSVQNPWKSRG